MARSRVAGGAGLEALVDRPERALLVYHSEKEQTAATFKHTFGYPPVRREVLLIRAEVRDLRR